MILVMLPAGAATEGTLAELLPLLSAGDTLMDGGNAASMVSRAWGPPVELPIAMMRGRRVIVLRN